MIEQPFKLRLLDSAAELLRRIARAAGTLAGVDQMKGIEGALRRHAAGDGSGLPVVAAARDVQA